MRVRFAHCYRVRPLNESGELGDEIGIPEAVVSCPSAVRRWCRLRRCVKPPPPCTHPIIPPRPAARLRHLAARAYIPRGRPRPRGCSHDFAFVLTDRIFPTRCPALEHNGKSATSPVWWPRVAVTRLL